MTDYCFTPWPTHADGSNKTMGQMTPEERRAQMADAVQRFKAKSLPGLRAALAQQEEAGQ